MLANGSPRGRGTLLSWSQLLLRLVILTSPLLALVAARIAGSPLFPIELTVLAFAVGCAFKPDTHVGLVAILLLGANWVVAVEDSTNPWSIGVAASIGLLHTAVAAASVAPTGAAWDPKLARLWGARLLIGAILGAPVWLVVEAIERADPEPGRVVFVGALIALVFAAIWLGGWSPRTRRSRHNS